MSLENIIINLKRTFWIIFISFFIYSCAAVSPPRGGPEDTTPPELIASSPEAGTLQFKGGEVTLTFSEYIDEKSIISAIQISPVLDPPIEIVYDDDQIVLEFPNELLPDQTYVITINRNLKDERKVALKESIQIAFSTGNIIDKGEIKGHIYGEDNYVVHLWKLLDGFTDSIFVKEPLYISEANDDGFFSFKYLSSGDYSLLGLERAAAGAALVRERMSYGVSPKKIYSVGVDSIISGIPLRPNREIPKLKLNFGEWVGKKWGWINFNQDLDNPIFEGIRLVDSQKKKIAPQLNQDLADKKKFLMLSPDTLSKGKSEFTIDNLLINGISMLENAKINFRTISKIDTSYLKIVKPESATSIRLDKDGGPLVPIIFSKPILEFSDSAFFVVSDSDTVVTKVNWANPIEISFKPNNGWEDKKDYQLMIFSNRLTPIEGKSLKDSIVYINIKSDKALGYGGLSGEIEYDSESAIIELMHLENKSEVFYSSVNSNNQFEFNKIPEGSYSMMIIDDKNNDSIYTNGSVFPFKASEWFYSHPDTFDVRANWDVDIGIIKLLEGK